MKFTARQLEAMGARRKGAPAALPKPKRKAKALPVNAPGIAFETVVAPRQIIMPDMIGLWLHVTIPMKTRNILNLKVGSSRFSQRHEKRRQRKHVRIALTSTAGYVSGLESMFGGEPVVLLTRVAPSTGLDFDGLLAALKSCRDGIADWLGVDDRDPRVKWEYDQRRGPYAVEVTIRRQPC